MSRWGWGARSNLGTSDRVTERELEDARARLREIEAPRRAPVETPSRPCEACRGTARVPPREDGSWEGTTACGECRGWGRVALTEEEVRAEYRTARAEAARMGVGPRAFDDAARARLAGGKTPAHWLRAARAALGDARKAADPGAGKKDEKTH